MVDGRSHESFQGSICPTNNISISQQYLSLSLSHSHSLRVCCHLNELLYYIWFDFRCFYFLMHRENENNKLTPTYHTTKHVLTEKSHGFILYTKLCNSIQSHNTEKNIQFRIMEIKCISQSLHIIINIH